MPITGLYTSSMTAGGVRDYVNDLGKGRSGGGGSAAWVGN